MLSANTLNFASRFPIDMIVQSGEITITNDGDTTSQTGTFNSAKIVQQTAANTHGAPTLARARWSIDNRANWQSMEAKLIYTFAINPLGVTGAGLDSAISIGTDSSLIYFRTANGRHGDISNADTTPTYTPTSRTFIIQYWMYELGI